MELKGTEEMELQEDAKDLPASTTTTTTPILAAWQNLPNPCKFRGHTIEILEALYDCGNLYSREIAAIVRLDIKIVNAYCHQGKKNAILVKVDKWKWMITDFGKYVLEVYNKYNIKDNSKSSQEQFKDHSNIIRTFNSEKNTHQLNLDVFLKNEDLTELQRVVVVAMAKHYEDTRRPYYKVQRYDDFRDQIGLSKSYSYEDVLDVVISLEVAGIIYNIKQGDYIKIGLLKSTIENLQNA